MKNMKTRTYTLPNDEQRLIVDAITFGMLEAIADGPNMMSREVIEEKAKRTCQHFKATIGNYTNNEKRFQEIFIANYAEGYLAKQKVYSEDITLHDKEVQQIREWGGFQVAFPMLRAYIESHLARGNA